MKKPKVLGHRGCAGLEPENTIRAFKRALSLKVDLIEFDVRMTKDKKLVVIHDPKLDRTTNGQGCIRNFIFNEIRKFEPHLKTGAILAGRPVNLISISRETKTNLLCLSQEFIDEEVVKKCHQNGIEINAWTVNESEDIERMIKLGVDIISSDYPDRVLSKLKK